MTPQRKDFKVISDKKAGFKKQKNAILNQTGTGLITSVLAIAIPALITLVTKK